MIFQKKNAFFVVLVMLSGFLLLFTTAGLAAEVSSVSQAQALIDASGATWKAGKTSVFGVPAEQLCGSELHPDAAAAEAPSSVLGDAYPSAAPSTWDWRSYGGHDWTTPIRNQGGCGSCYIFGTHAAAEAAMKIQAGTYGYLAEPDLSEQFTLVCPGLGSCTGGSSQGAVDFLKNSGTTDDVCFPYTASDSTPCTNRCSNWADRLHWINAWGHPGGYPNYYPSVAQIKDAIMTYGPVSTYMYVYTDFRDYYTGGVYQHTFGTALGGHTVTIVGWNDSLQCWIVKNSWGTGWGESGWFRIKWGEVDIERQTEWVNADLPNMPGAAAFSNVTQTSIRANWTANGNPGGTLYYCENTTAGTSSGWTTSTTWNSTGLTPNTSYAFRVKARNGKSVETAWKSLGSKSTLPVGNPCEGDFDGDGDVDGSDLAVFAADFGRTDCASGPPCEGDFNGDGDVDGSDLAVFAADFGRTDCP